MLEYLVTVLVIIMIVDYFAKWVRNIHLTRVYTSPQYISATKEIASNIPLPTEKDFEIFLSAMLNMKPQLKNEMVSFARDTYNAIASDERIEAAVHKMSFNESTKYTIRAATRDYDWRKNTIAY